MKKFNLLFTLLFAAGLLFIGCSDDDDDEPTTTTSSSSTNTPAPTQNIAEIAQTSGITDSLVVALSEVGLVPTFQSSGTFTVFAPTNDAFVALLGTNTMWNRISDIDSATLDGVLKYHVLGKVKRAADLTDDMYAVTLNSGAPNNENTVIEIDVTGGIRLNNDANVNASAANIEATNGVVHVIDKVIMPQNIVQLASSDERFSSLVAALTSNNFTFATTLSGPGPFTVFAPTNDAFQALLDMDTTWNTISDIDPNLLSSVLTYHVVSGVNAQAKNLSQGMKVATLQGDSLTVDLMGSPKLGTTSGQDVNIIVTDVQGTNGVIHAIDKVMLPN